MGILDFFAKKPQVNLDDELVSTLGISSLFTLDGLKFNPDKIGLDVYAKIAKHYQVKAAISSISFSVQQIEWFIQSDDPEIQKVVQFAIDRIWNSLIRSVSKAFRYGFSPNVKVFELAQVEGKEYIIYKKIKDLDPVLCSVRVDKFGNFDGFYYKTPLSIEPKGQIIEPDYAFWYTSDMENGNQYGNSALKSVYKSWFYSEKMHQFCNRYYERFGEPLVIGRSPSASYVKDPVTGKSLSAQEAMRLVIDGIRSHSSAQLPSDKDEKGNYTHDLNYLESQMRGFDFENYLSRLDREICLGLLFPSLMLGGDKGGSYALGATQIQAFYTNLMGMMDNVTDYVNAYIIPQLVEYNFGPNKKAVLSYQPLSVDAKKNIHEMLMQLIKNSEVVPNKDQLEARSGIKLEKPTAIPKTPKGAVPIVKKSGAKETVIK